jgi:hypothetical protein
VISADLLRSAGAANRIAVPRLSSEQGSCDLLPIEVIAGQLQLDHHLTWGCASGHGAARRCNTRPRSS